MDLPNHAPILNDPNAAHHGTPDQSLAVGDHTHAAEAAVRRALFRHGALTTSADAIAHDADLYAAGLTSHATVNVMLAVETELDVEFPDELLTRSTFASIDALTAAVDAARR